MGKYSDHSTYVNNKNEEVPSVTTILKVLNKPGLVHWANSLGWKRQSYDKILEERADHGTFVHELLHEYMFKEGKQFNINGPETVELIKKYLEGFKYFEEQVNLKPIWGEKSFSCEWYGGTIDLLCEIDGKITILDFKTSKRFYSSHFIQLGAYIQLLDHNGIIVEQVGIARVDESGVNLKIKSRDEMDDYVDLFNSLLNTFHIVYELNKEWGDML